MMKNQDNLFKFKRNLRNISVVCLLCSGDEGCGLRMIHFQKIFDNFLSKKPLSLSDKPKSFVYSKEFAEIFDMCAHDSQPWNVGLYCTTLIEHHTYNGWLSEHRCIYFQEGFRSISKHRDSDMEKLNTLFESIFGNKTYDDILFENVFDFAAWFLDINQKSLYALSVNHTTIQQLHFHGQTMYHRRNKTPSLQQPSTQKILKGTIKIIVFLVCSLLVQS